MKRRKAEKKNKPVYPGLRDADMNRRRFISMLAKSALGIAVLGAAACDETGSQPAGDVVQDAEADRWVNAGVAPPDLFEEDVVLPDTLIEEDQWVTGGVARPPEDIVEIEDIPEPDYQMGGVPRAPDDIEDVKEEDEYELQGGAPMPEDLVEEDVKPDTGPDVEEDYILSGFAAPPEED